MISKHRCTGNIENIEIIKLQIFDKDHRSITSCEKLLIKPLKSP